MDDELGSEDASAHTVDGVEHLQAAAKELIAAGRAFLDAAEHLVEDPTVVTQLVGGLGSLVKLATAAARPPAPSGEDDEPKVQRIRVS